jgi:hypothetical protein
MLDFCISAFLHFCISAFLHGSLQVQSILFVTALTCCKICHILLIYIYIYTVRVYVCVCVCVYICIYKLTYLELLLEIPLYTLLMILS